MWRVALTRKLQRLFWIYCTNNFIIKDLSDFTLTTAPGSWRFTPITLDNYFRVKEFRESSRVDEYRAKIQRGEIGYFVEFEGIAIASIWATINTESVPRVARMYMRLLPNEALIHDIVTAEKYRGRGIGPFMVGRFASILLTGHNVARITIDVNVRNHASLRMMHKAGLEMKQKVLYVSAFGRLVFQRVLRDVI